MNKLKVSTRLAWGFGSLIAVLIVIILTSLLRLKSLNTSLDMVIHDRVPKVEKYEDIAFKAMDNARVVRNIVLLTDEQAMVSNKALFDKNNSDISNNIAYLEKAISTSTGKETLKDVKDTRSAYEAYTQEVMALGLSNKIDEATRVLYGEKYKTQSAYFSAIRKAVDAQRSLMEDAGKAAFANYHNARMTLLALGVVAVLLGKV